MKTISKEKSQTRFTSSLGTILTLAGATIGIGNFWRFPYMMGQYGGSAFLLLFLLFIVLFAIPALIAEMTIARQMRASTITIFERSYGVTGRYLGYIVLVSMMVLLSVYILVVGQSLFSAYFAMVVGFDTETVKIWNERFPDPQTQYLFAIFILWISLFVCSFGLSRGIERVSRFIVPFFFLTVLYTIYFAFKQPNAIEEFTAFLIPDFSKIGPKQVFAAMGQAFFSVGLGAIVIIGYAKVFRDDENISATATYTALNDTLASVLATLFVIPVVLDFSMPIESGPTLYFDTMPRIFSVMDGGRLIGGFLMAAFALMSFLSVVAGMQFVVTSLEERAFFRKISSRKLLLCIGALETLLLLIPTFQPGALETIDIVFGSGVIIAGSFLMVVTLTWVVDKQGLLCRIFERKYARVNQIFYLWLKWAVPGILLLILFGTLVDKLS